MRKNNNTFLEEITRLFEEAVKKNFPESVLKAIESEKIKNE